MNITEKLSGLVERLKTQIGAGQVLDLLEHDDPKLRQPSQPYLGDAKTDTDLHQFAANLVTTMLTHRAAGISAIQVGSPVALIVVCDYQSDPVLMLNPRVTKASAVVRFTEGCLSFPGLMYSISRPGEVTVTYTDLDGKMQELQASGLLARAIQHEVDHVNGKLFVDLIPSIERRNVRKKIEIAARKRK